MTPNTRHWGATQDDWIHFELVLGLAPDLLPVVSNPTATISPDSKMQGIGKIPSWYNGNRQVVGIPEWTSRRTNSKEIEAWSKEIDFGAALQMRRVRAIDVDIEDPAQAAAVREFISARYKLPERMRSDSSKFLLIFECPGDLSKRRFKTEHGIVEFLATGQQAVIAGTHPKGARYEFRGGRPDTIPAVSVEQFEDLWQALVAAFAVGGSSTSAPSVKREKLANAVHSDPVARHLYDQEMVKSLGNDGRLHVVCPFEHEHTSDTGDTATVYWPPHTGG